MKKLIGRRSSTHETALIGTDNANDVWFQALSNNGCQDLISNVEQANASIVLAIAPVTHSLTQIFCSSWWKALLKVEPADPILSTFALIVLQSLNR